MKNYPASRVKNSNTSCFHENFFVNPFLARGYFFCLLRTFTNSFDQFRKDQMSVLIQIHFSCFQEDEPGEDISLSENEDFARSLILLKYGTEEEGILYTNLQMRAHTVLPAKSDSDACFVYKIIRDLESIDHLLTNPIRRIRLIHKRSFDSCQLK